jgi:DNA repair exonuclease SbcCD nuclease subunit
MIRFLHAADLHLGMRVTRFTEDACKRVGEARFAALEQLRRKAAEHQAQFLVVAGDVFDDHSVPRIGVASRALPILESSREACPVFVIPGNHDPLVPGGVWDRDPWQREQPHYRVHFLRKPEPVEVANLPVTIFPCPLRQRRSMDDPTAWIANHPRGPDERTIRIGLAHGSLNIMRLPDDDHLIRPDAADRYELDYLALGHWHKPYLHPSADGTIRTAYSGTHEPMNFAEADSGLATGWSSYSSDGDAERFRDGGQGFALLVTIDGPKAPPTIEKLEIGRLRWSAEFRDATAQPFGKLIGDFSQRETPERIILRLAMTGVVDPRVHSRIDELRQIILHRYHAGSSLDADGVLIEPSAEQLAEVVGEGVLKRVLERLKADEQSSAPDARSIAAHALRLLYRIAWEEQPA